MTQLTLDLVRDGLTIVDNNCDGVKEKDSIGFNRVHAEYARTLLINDEWNDIEAYKACKMFVFYKKQHNLPLEDVKELMVRLESKQTGKIVIEENIATISFDYKAELVAGVKTLEKAKYQAENKTWKVTIENEKQLDKLNEFAQAHGFIITGKFVPVISSTPSIVKPVFNGVIKIEKKTLIITFQYNSETVQDLKDIEVFKKWNAQNKTWEIKNFSDIDLDFLKQLVDFGKKWNLDIDSDFLKLSTPKIVMTEDAGKLLNDLKAKYPTAHPYQLDGMRYVIKKKKAYNGDTMGLGKAQSLDSKVLTPNGFVLMKDIQLGMEVINELGTISKVIGVYPQGLKDIYKVTFSDNSSTECCDEHLWNIQTPTMRFSNSNNYYTKQLKDFKDSLYTDSNNKKYFIPIVKPIHFDEKEYLIHPYILGAILGDGNFSAHTLTITKGDPELFINISKYLPKEIKLSDTNNPITKKFVSNNITRLNIFIKELKRLNLMGKTSKDKFIPKEYLLGSIEQRIWLIQGLLDTDGFVNKTGLVLQYSSISKQLIDNTQFIIQSLSGICTLSEKIGSYTKNNEKIECEKCYTLTINLPSFIQPVTLSRKLSRLKIKIKYLPRRAFMKVEYIGKKEAQCIAIDSPTKLYITDDFIVTHNTFQTLGAIDFNGSLPALVVCPNTLKYNWDLEVEKFISTRSSFVISAKDKTIPEGKDIYIINYDIVGKKLDLLKEIPFKFIACDEAHYIKNDKTARYKAIVDLIETLDIEYRVLLSGTCITNRPKELVPQLKALGVLHKMVNKDWDFYLRYCNAYRTDFGWDLSGASNTQELHQKLTKYCYFRREKEEVLKDLPEKQRNNVYLEIDNLKEYNKALVDLISYLSELKKEEVTIGAQHLVQIEVLKQLVAKGKLEAVKTWINDFVENDEKLIVFAHHKEIISSLKESYPDALCIDGSTSTEDRQKAVTEFQTNLSKKLIFCSIKSASVGLTLTASSNVAFIELPWTPGDLDQAEDRAHRIGQKNNVNIYYLLGKNTIEDLKIMPLIEKKRAVFNAVARGQEVKQKDLQTSMLSELVKSLLK